jgi:hypothetical protein
MASKKPTKLITIHNAEIVLSDMSNPITRGKPKQEDGRRAGKIIATHRVGKIEGETVAILPNSRHSRIVSYRFLAFYGRGDNRLQPVGSTGVGPMPPPWLSFELTDASETAVTVNIRASQRSKCL